MKTIAPFINLGWHTVPLKGELKRKEDGSKTLPQFEKDWRKKYSEEFNEKASKIGGTITGNISNIIAIDCDNELTYSLFSSLDPNYDFRFVSQGKGKEAGTLIYEYDEDFTDSFSVNDGTLALDFYSDNGFVYLPTEANETKVAWNGKLPKLAKMPETVKTLLRQIQNKPKASAETTAPTSQNIMTANCLQPLVRQFVDKRKFMPGLFKILTPRSFRDLDQYVKEGFLHPANIPPGRGSEYLSKVSAILGADMSIDEELYIQALHDINDLWDEPMDPDRLDKTIAEPMLEGRSSIDGKPIWHYDKHWGDHRLILGTKRQASIDIGYDDMRTLYYCVDQSNEKFKMFSSDGELMSYISSVAIQPPKKAEVLRALPIINVESLPNKPFGYCAEADPTARTLNTFIQTPELQVLNNPESYKKLYRKPEATLNYLATLVPNENMRQFLLQFIKRKLTTFEYSPVILYFMGVQGSGKDTFVQILEKIMGHISRPTTKEFLEQFNGWMLDTHFAQLDEYGNQLSLARDKDEALGKLKAYTGKDTVQIRKMRTDGFDYKHRITFIMTANKNPLMLEDGDRRIAFFATPTVLTDVYDDVPELHRKIMSETKDLCYYLATEVEMMPLKAYMTPPMTEDKHELVANSMHAAARLAYAFKHNMIDYVKNLALDVDQEFKVTGTRVYLSDLEDIYLAMTDYNGDMKSLVKTFRSSSLVLHRSSKGGEHSYYFEIEDTF